MITWQKSGLKPPSARSGAAPAERYVQLYLCLVHRSSHRRCSVRRDVLEDRSFANSQENTCARVSF